jgi:hypothetical protein
MCFKPGLVQFPKAAFDDDIADLPVVQPVEHNDEMAATKACENAFGV